MHGGKNLHRHLARIVADELRVDVHDAPELPRQVLGVFVRQVEVDDVLAADAHALVHADVEDLARRNVARHEVAVLGILLFKEVPALGLGDLPRIAVVAGLPRHPHTPALAAGRLAHEPALVRAGNGRRVHLDHLAIGVPRARLVAAAGRPAGAHHGVRALAEDEPASAGRHHDGIGAERTDLHRPHVLGDDADAALRLALTGDHRREELPELVLADAPLHLPPACLLIQRVKELLPRRRPGEVRALEERAAEETKIAEPLGRAVEGHAHAVEQVDDPRRPVGHLQHRVLIGQVVAAVDRLIKVLVLAVPLLARDFVARVDAALGAHGVRPLDRHHGEEIHRHTRLGDADGGGETGEPPADDDDARLIRHGWVPVARFAPPRLPSPPPPPPLPSLAAAAASLWAPSGRGCPTSWASTARAFS